MDTPGWPCHTQCLSPNHSQNRGEGGGEKAYSYSTQCTFESQVSVCMLRVHVPWEILGSVAHPTTGAGTLMTAPCLMFPTSWNIGHETDESLSHFSDLEIQYESPGGPHCNSFCDIGVTRYIEYIFLPPQNYSSCRLTQQGPSLLTDQEGE